MRNPGTDINKDGRPVSGGIFVNPLKYLLNMEDQDNPTLIELQEFTLPDQDSSHLAYADMEQRLISVQFEGKFPEDVILNLENPKNGDATRQKRRFRLVSDGEFYTASFPPDNVDRSYMLMLGPDENSLWEEVAVKNIGIDEKWHYYGGLQIYMTADVIIKDAGEEQRRELDLRERFHIPTDPFFRGKFGMEVHPGDHTFYDRLIELTDVDNEQIKIFAIEDEDKRDDARHYQIYYYCSDMITEASQLKGLEEFLDQEVRTSGILSEHGDVYGAEGGHMEDKIQLYVAGKILAMLKEEGLSCYWHIDVYAGDDLPTMYNEGDGLTDGGEYGNGLTDDYTDPGDGLTDGLHEDGLTDGGLPTDRMGDFSPDKDGLTDGGFGDPEPDNDGLTEGGLPDDRSIRNKNGLTDGDDDLTDP